MIEIRKIVQSFALMSVFKKLTTKSGLEFTLVYSPPLVVHVILVTINI